MSSRKQGESSKQPKDEGRETIVAGIIGRFHDGGEYMRDVEWTEEEMLKLEENLGRLGTPEERRASVDAIARAGVRLYFERLKSKMEQFRSMPQDLYPGVAPAPALTPGEGETSGTMLAQVNRIAQEVRHGQMTWKGAIARLCGVLHLDRGSAEAILEEACPKVFKRYVVGLVFDHRLEHGGKVQAPPTSVLLICKAKPAWQAGRYNGVGGSIEEGETDSQAMARETQEESEGVLQIPPEQWRWFATLSGDEVYNPPKGLPAGTTAEFQIEMFCAFTSLEAMVRSQAATSKLREPLLVMDLVESLTDFPRNGEKPRGVLPNIPWLICMALGKLRGESAERFVVREVGAPKRERREG